MADTIDRPAAALPTVANDTTSYDDILDTVLEYLQENGIPNDEDSLAAASKILGRELTNDNQPSNYISWPGASGYGRWFLDNFGFTFNMDLHRRYPTHRLISTKAEGIQSTYETALPEGEGALHIQRLPWIPVNSPPPVMDGEGLLVQVMSTPHSSCRGFSGARPFFAIIDEDDSSTKFYVNGGFEYYETVALFQELGYSGIEDGAGLTIAFVPPKDHWMYERGFIMLIDSQVDAYLQQAILYVRDKIPHLSKNDVKRETVLGIIRQAQSESANVRNVITERESSIAHNRESIRRFSRDIANLHRTSLGLMSEVKHMSRSIVPIALENIKSYKGICDLLSIHKAVRDAEVKIVNGNMNIVVETYPYVMHLFKEGYEDCDDCCSYSDDGCDCSCHSGIDSLFDIQPALITIDTSSTSVEDAVSIKDFDGQILVHPHISIDASICWGNALGRMAESWGMRDWNGLLIVVLGWLTQYSKDNEPHRDARSLLDEYGSSNYGMMGWVTPDKEGNQV